MQGFLSNFQEKVLAVTYYCRETEPHQPTGFSSLLLSLGDYLVNNPLLSNISTRLLATEVAGGKANRNRGAGPSNISHPPLC
jgi:hypothetical protein